MKKWKNSITKIRKEKLYFEKKKLKKIWKKLLEKSFRRSKKKKREYGRNGCRDLLEKAKKEKRFGWNYYKKLNQVSTQKLNPVSMRD